MSALYITHIKLLLATFKVTKWMELFMLNGLNTDYLHFVMAFTCHSRLNNGVSSYKVYLLLLLLLFSTVINVPILYTRYSFWDMDMVENCKNWNVYSSNKKINFGYSRNRELRLMTFRHSASTMLCISPILRELQRYFSYLPRDAMRN